MENSNLIFLGLLLAAGIYTWIKHTENIAADARAMFWATVNEPLVFVSRHPFDTDIVASAIEARKNLKEHGNPYLTDSDVWEYVFGAHEQNVSRDYSLWLDFAFQDIIKRREAWRKEKFGYNQNAAKAEFSSQKMEWT